MRNFILGAAVFGMAFIAMRHLCGISAQQAFGAGIIMIIACCIDNAIDQ